MHVVKLILLICTILSTALIKGQDLTEPSPWGGQATLKSLIFQEMVYPSKELDDKVRGPVEFSFIVDKNGVVQNLQVTSSPSDELRKEAVRLFRMIAWEPAFNHDGNTIRSQHLKITFHPGPYKRSTRKRGYTIPPQKYQPFDSSLFVYSGMELDLLPEPIFPGNCIGLNDFYRKNLSYPELALKKGVSGKVEMELIVEPSGRMHNIRIIKGVGAGCDEEAIRLIRLLKWKPAMKDGTYVRAKFKLSIIFALPGGSDYKYFPTHHGTTMQ